MQHRAPGFTSCLCHWPTQAGWELLSVSICSSRLQHTQQYISWGGLKLNSRKPILIPSIMSLIKCKAPPGKGSWLNRFLSDITNLQNPSTLTRDVWGKISSATERESRSNSSALGPDKPSTPTLGGWREIPGSAGRERRRGRDTSIHGTSTAAQCAHAKACRSQSSCFPWQS